MYEIITMSVYTVQVTKSKDEIKNDDSDDLL
jgi:hypothetical protein